MYASLFFSESTLEEEREKIKKYFRTIPPPVGNFSGPPGNCKGVSFLAEKDFLRFLGKFETIRAE